MSFDITRVKIYVEVVAIFIAAFWAFYVFYYEEHVAPLHLPPHVTMQADLQKSDSLELGHALYLATSLHNKSKTKVHVLGYWFNVFAVKFKKTPQLDTKVFTDALIKKYTEDSFPLRVRRDYEYEKIDYLDSGKVVDKGWWLEADESIYNKKAIIVPQGYDLVFVRVLANIVKHIDGVQTQWVLHEKKQSIRQIKLLKTANGNFERFDINNPGHIRIRDDIGLSLTKVETVAFLK